MKKIIYTLLSIVFCHQAFAGDITFEAASGCASPYTPFSAHWNGAVRDNGLFHREFSCRVGYDLKDWLSVSGTIGWLKNRDYDSRPIFIDPEPIPPYGYHYSNPLTDVTYLIPSLKFSSENIRLDFGAIIYSSSITNGSRNFNYPFNGSHRFKPAIGVELGGQGVYLFTRLLDSFPLYSGGLASVGVGGRVGGKYEQQFSFLGGPFEITGFGYRGEFRVYQETAFSIGLSIGFPNANNNDAIYLFSFGLKTIL